MHKPLFVLLIHEVSTDTEPIRQALSELEGFQLKCATRFTFADFWHTSRRDPLRDVLRLYGPYCEVSASAVQRRR